LVSPDGQHRGGRRSGWALGPKAVQ